MPSTVLDPVNETAPAPGRWRGGRNTGYLDALGVLVRVLQRGYLLRSDIEEVIRTNCLREGREVPTGPSMQRRVERLRSTLERGGLLLEPGPVTQLGRRPRSEAPSSWCGTSSTDLGARWPS